MILKQIARWGLFFVCLVFGFLYLNDTVGSWWVSWGPPTDYPRVWEHQAVVRFCVSLAFLATAPMVFLVFKEGFNLKRSVYKYVWLLIVIVAISYPQIRKFLKVDSCLDSGGKWSEELFECETE